MGRPKKRWGGGLSHFINPSVPPIRKDEEAHNESNGVCQVARRLAVVLCGHVLTARGVKPKEDSGSDRG